MFVASVTHLFDHFAFAVERGAGRDIVAGANHFIALPFAQRADKIGQLHLSASLFQRGGQHGVVGRDRYTLEDVIQSMLQCGLGAHGLETPFIEVGLFVHLRERASIFWRETVELLLANLRRGNVDQLIRAGIADQNSDFVIGGFAPVLFNEPGDSRFACLASAAELLDEILRYAFDFESVLPVRNGGPGLHAQGSCGRFP